MQTENKTTCLACTPTGVAWFGLIRPKATIICGQCKAIFVTRLPIINNPNIQCNHCKTSNIVPILWEPKQTPREWVRNNEALSILLLLITVFLVLLVKHITNK